MGGLLAVLGLALLLLLAFRRWRRQRLLRPFKNDPEDQDIEMMNLGEVRLMFVFCLFYLTCCCFRSREQIQKVENTQEGRFWKKMVHRRGAREGDPLPPDTKTRQDKKTPQSKHSFERELNKFKDEVALFYKNKKNN